MTKPNIYYARKVKKAKAIPDPRARDLALICLYMKRLSREIRDVAKVMKRTLFIWEGVKFADSIRIVLGDPTVRRTFDVIERLEAVDNDSMATEGSLVRPIYQRHALGGMVKDNEILLVPYPDASDCG